MLMLSPARPLPIEPPLPSREGARGRGFVPTLSLCPGKAGSRRDGMQQFSSIDSPLPLSPSRKGRGDSEGLASGTSP
jgi:hypothetical protein